MSAIKGKGSNAGCAGIRRQPRWIFGCWNFAPGSDIGRPDPGSDAIIRNREKYPIIITHAMWAIGAADPDPAINMPDTPPAGSEQIIGRYLVNTKGFPTYVQNDRFMSIAALSNISTCTGQPTYRSTASTTFRCPFHMANRDAFEVKMRLRHPYPSQCMASITFSGIEIDTQAPVFLSSQVMLQDTSVITLGLNGLEWHGPNPVLITDMTVSISAPEDSPSAVGDIHNLEIGVRQLGKEGNSRAWMHSSGSPSPYGALIPASLIGTEVGRDVVFRYPIDGRALVLDESLQQVIKNPDQGQRGLILAPGEYVEVELQHKFNRERLNNEKLWMALHGCMLVQK